jgi:hypothetical protein
MSLLMWAALAGLAGAAVADVEHGLTAVASAVYK